VHLSLVFTLSGAWDRGGEVAATEPDLPGGTADRKRKK